MINFQCRVKPYLWLGVKTSQSLLTSVKTLTVSEHFKTGCPPSFSLTLSDAPSLSMCFSLPVVPAAYGELEVKSQVVQLFYDGGNFCLVCSHLVGTSL